MNENNQPNQQGGQEGQQTPPTPQPPYQPPYGSQPPYDGQMPPPYQSPYEKPGQQPYQPPYCGYPPPEPPKTRAPLNPETIKLFNILSYFSFLWLVGLIADGHNPKVRYHVNQGILLTIFEVVLGLVVSLLSSLFTSLFSVALGGVMVFAQLGSTLVGLVQLAQFGAVAALIIVGVMHAVQDREEPLPLIGSLFTILK